MSPSFQAGHALLIGEAAHRLAIFNALDRLAEAAAASAGAGQVPAGAYGRSPAGQSEQGDRIIVVIGSI